jgi:hypothetical protein
MIENTKNKPIRSLYWETPNAKEAFEKLLPSCQRIRDSISRMEAKGRESKRIQSEIDKTNKLLDLTNRNKEKEEGDS